MKRFFTTSGLTLKKGILLVVLLIGVFWSGSGAYTMYIRYSQSKDDYKRSRVESANLEAREATLRDNIRNLQTSRGVEGELRTRFNAAKEGEELIMVVEGKNTANALDVSATPVSLWQKIKNWFK